MKTKHQFKYLDEKKAHRFFSNTELSDVRKKRNEKETKDNETLQEN